jgi:ribosomal protein L44E
MGNVIRYWKQNSSPTYFGALLKQFAYRLSRRGHEKRAVMHGIEKATKYVDENLTCRKTKMVAKKEVRTLFLHWQYHPKDITRQTLRRLYDETLAGISGFEKMTFFYSRPRNLRESLTRTLLSEPDGERVSDLIQFLDPSGIREFQNNEHQLRIMNSAPPAPSSPVEWV